MSTPAPAESEALNPFQELVASLRALPRLNRVFWICNFIYFLDGAAYFGILNILTLFIGQKVGLSDRWTGISVSFMTGLLTFFSATLGGVSDRLGVRRTLTLTIVAALAGRLILTLAPGLPLAAATAWVGLALIAFSAGVMQPAVYSGVKQSTDSGTSAIGFSLVYALMNGGIVAESFFSSLVRQRWQTTGVLWMCTGLTIVYLLVHLVFFPRGAGGPMPKRAAPVEVAPVNYREVETVKRRGSWRDHPLMNPRFLFFISVLLGVRTLFAHQWLTMPDYVTRAYPPAVGARFEWINGLNPLIVLIGTPLCAALTRRVHVVTMMIAGTLVSAAASFLLVPGPFLGPLLAYEIIFSIGEALWSSRFLEYVADVAPAESVGLYMGVAQIPWFIAKFTTGFYSGYMLERFCPPTGAQHTQTMWLLYAIIGMTTPIGLLLARRWLAAGRLDDHVRAAA
jgi:dipeptide/tripeptide permease